MKMIGTTVVCKVCNQPDEVKFKKPQFFSPSLISHTCSKCKCVFLYKFRLMPKEPKRCSIEAQLESYPPQIAEIMAQAAAKMAGQKENDVVTSDLNT